MGDDLVLPQNFLLTKHHCLYFLTHPSAQCTLALPHFSTVMALTVATSHLLSNPRSVPSPHLPASLSFHDPALSWLPSAGLAAPLLSPMWACLLAYPECSGSSGFCPRPSSLPALSWVTSSTPTLEGKGMSIVPSTGQEDLQK